MEAEASSKNHLHQFAGATTISGNPPPPKPSNSGDDVELSLTLSLGGSFGSNKLVRSSSISSFPSFDPIKEEKESLQVGHTAQLHRTCSLPVSVPVSVAGDDEEDYRKRKEMQSLKRLEAKRKRSEKRNGSKGDDPGSCLLGLGNQAAAPRLQPFSQGSIGSVGSSSSNDGSMLGFDIVKFNNSEGKSSSIPNETNQKTSPEMTPLRKIERKSSGMNEMERGVMEEMPYVSTRGLGPNGKKVDGFLYKYRKGEVRIVCVCHGRFLTPAEFVMHAGGGAVDHPLRHIVVSASHLPSCNFLF